MLIVPAKFTAPFVPKTPGPVLLIVPAPEIVPGLFQRVAKGIAELISSVATAATVFAPFTSRESLSTSVPAFTVVGPV